MSDEQTTPPEEQADLTVEESTDADAEEQVQGPPPEMRAEDALRFVVGLFADLAWINMGIRANPATNETKTDLEQARLAIDAIGALVQLTEGRFDPREVREMNNLLSTMRLNYVERAAK